MTGCLSGLVDPAVVSDVELCASELAANAIRHARSAFTVELLQNADHLRIAVHDDDPNEPHAGEVDATSVSGRGLFIVESVADRWGWAADPDGGKDVWFELDDGRER